MIGQMLAHYRVIGKLGAGGMGEVYRAHDERLDRDVAIKVLPPSTFGDPAARARLLREARAAAASNHPHVCTIHEVGEANGRPSGLEGGNTLVTPQGRAKVLDFGLARRASGKEVADATTAAHDSLRQDGALMGTLPYMAPEQLRGDVSDSRSDVWALGVMLHEMAPGVRPFRARTGL